jgi:hypothetical protein
LTTAHPLVHFASGKASFHGKDNDFEGTGTRGNAFGDQGKANVTGNGGSKYRSSWLFRVNDRCHLPDDGPPACLLDSSTLPGTDQASSTGTYS